MDCYSRWMQNYYDSEDYHDIAPEDEFVIPKHWEKRKWYSKYPLSNREEDNLVMDEMEGEGYRD